MFNPHHTRLLRQVLLSYFQKNPRLREFNELSDSQLVKCQHGDLSQVFLTPKLIPRVLEGWGDLQVPPTLV